MPHRSLKIATRKSPLALWQANHVAQLLRQHHPGLNVSLVPLTTSGDRILNFSLSTVGGKGLFVKELEEALLEYRADIAVHSMKDVPVFFPEGLCLGAICERDNPLDALISLKYPNLESLPSGALIGTSSLRRQSQLLAIRPDLKILPLRGNLQTRLTKLNDLGLDAIILAVAGLVRLGMRKLIREILPAEIMLPACGQGALGIECRIEDSAIKAIIDPLNHPLTAICVQSERLVNAHLGGNCHVPLAVYATLLSKHELLLRSRVATFDGKTILNNQQSGPIQESLELAKRASNELKACGALMLMEQK